MKKLLLLCIYALTFCTLTLQSLECQTLSWNKVTNLPSRSVQALHSTPLNDVFVAFDSTSLFQTSNNGISWQSPVIGFGPFRKGKDNEIRSMVSDSSSTLVFIYNSITLRAVLRFNKSQNRWDTLGWNIPYTPTRADFLGGGGTQVVDAVHNQQRFLTLRSGLGGGGVFTSPNGNVWDVLTTQADTFYSKRFNGLTLAVQGDTILVASEAPNRGLLWTINAGKTWDSAQGIQGTSYVRKIIKSDKLWCAVDEQNIYVSENAGKTWLRKFTVNANTKINTIAALGKTLLIGTTKGLFTSNDNAQNWTLENDGLANQNITHLISTKDYVFAGTTEGLFQAKQNPQTAIKAEITDGGKLSLSPNPCSDVLTVNYSINSNEVILWEIVSPSGTRVWQQQSTGQHSEKSEYRIGTRHLASGAYILRGLLNDKVQFSQMFFVQR